VNLYWHPIGELVDRIDPGLLDFRSIVRDDFTPAEVAAA
jgi:hypothetical protein